MTPLPDRLELLRRLTGSSPQWSLVKGAASALDGRGDIDSAAPAAAWPLLESELGAWASDTGRGPVVRCDHVPGTLILAAVEPGSPTTLVQLDAIDHGLRRGRPVVSAADLLPAAGMTPDGYRVLTPGAQAVARIVLDEWGRFGSRPAQTALDELRDLLRRDPAGARAVADRLELPLRAAVAAVEAGRSPRVAFALADAVYLSLALLRPLRLARRVAGRRERRACPVLRALACERTVEGDLTDWLRAVARVHPQPRL
jgi:hypothetical protein